jgi:hypothetical protein
MYFEGLAPLCKVKIFSPLCKKKYSQKSLQGEIT